MSTVLTIPKTLDRIVGLGFESTRNTAVTRDLFLPWLEANPQIVRNDGSLQEVYGSSEAEVKFADSRGWTMAAKMVARLGVSGLMMYLAFGEHTVTGKANPKTAGATTTTSADATAGDTVISVADASGFTAGDEISIGSELGEDLEWATIESIDTNDITITPEYGTTGLIYDHLSGAAVAEGDKAYLHELQQPLGSLPPFTCEIDMRHGDNTTPKTSLLLSGGQQTGLSLEIPLKGFCTLSGQWQGASVEFDTAATTPDWGETDGFYYGGIDNSGDPVIVVKLDNEEIQDMIAANCVINWNFGAGPRMSTFQEGVLTPEAILKGPNKVEVPITMILPSGSDSYKYVKKAIGGVSQNNTPLEFSNCSVELKGPALGDNALYWYKKVTFAKAAMMSPVLTGSPTDEEQFSFTLSSLYDRTLGYAAKTEWMSNRYKF